MEKTFRSWLADPLAIKIIIAIGGLIVLRIFVFFLIRSLGGYLKDSQTRYRTRKIITLISYFVIILFLAIVFKDQLGGLAIAFGVAGAVTSTAPR